MLTKRGRFYWADTYINGKRIRRSLKTTEKLVALDRLRVLQDKLLTKSQSKDIRLEDFCKQYLEWAWSEKPASAYHEQYRIKKLKAFFTTLNIEFLGDITPYHIEQVKAWLRSQKKPKLAKSTINLYLQQVRGMFYRAIDWGLYSGENPMKKVRSYRTSSVVTILTDAQVDKILKASRAISDNPNGPIQVDWYTMILLVLNTGMRKGEVLNLKWKDIKDDELVIRGKGEKTRIIPLNETALNLLTRHPKRDSEYVFDIPSRKHRWSIDRAVQKVRRVSGVPIFRMHLLRHYFATKLMENGVDIITISELLGHSKIMISLMYSHTNVNRKRSAVHGLDTK